MIHLEADSHPESIHYLSGAIELAEDMQSTTEMLTRTFTYPNDPYYGELKVTRAMLREMVSNFEAGVYGQEIPINLAHDDSHGAAGFIRKVFIKSGNKLMADIDWEPLGLDAIKNKGFRYFSIEFQENYEDPEKEEKHGSVLMGAALTIRPRVKHLDPVKPENLSLSYSDDEPRYILSNHAQIKLSEEITTMWKKIRAKLEADLKSKGLSEGHINSMLLAFDEKSKAMTEESQATALAEALTTAAVNLSEALQSGDAAGDQPLNINVNLGEGNQAGMSEADVRQLMETMQTKAAEDAAQLAEKLNSNVKKFTDKLEASESYKALSEEHQTTLLSTKEMISADMTEEQITALADQQITVATQLSVATQLAQQGFNQPGAAGRVHISVDESNSIKELQEKVDKRLGIAELSDTERFSAHYGKLPARVKNLTDKVLAAFDAERGSRLMQDVKHMAGGTGIISDVAVPAVFERTVIREVLYSMNMLNFVDIDSASFAATIDLPYSYRDIAAAGKGNTRVYERQAIKKAGVIQTSEEARPIPQKLAFEVSDELRYLTADSIYNWDAVAENTRNVIRIIREDTEQIVGNELLHSCLEFGAVAVAAENLELQADDAVNVLVLANFPIVRPRQAYNLKGEAVGNPTNPITVNYDGAEVTEYDGTGEQAAGTYYSLDYDLGEIRLVDEAGAVQVPADGTAYTIDYSYATNVYAFDTDLGGKEAEVHWNDFLYRYGLRKALIKDQRFYMPNMGLMSETYKVAVEQAKTFAANYSKPGTDLNADGDLGKIKGIPNFSHTAPGLEIGDRYALIGERNQTRFRMMKAWAMGELENTRNDDGDFIGSKEAYGDQFIVVHTPTQLKAATTSIMQYSASARVARTV